MKKLVFALSVVFLTASVSFAQDDKKQEPKKDKKEKEVKEEKPVGGTRMAINEKGQPGTKKSNSSTSKTATEKKEEPKN